MNNKQAIKKAKEKTYKHSIWFIEREKTIYEAMKYFVEHTDFHIDLKGSINYISQIDGYNGPLERKEIITYCIENFDEHWDKLIIRHSSRGTDRGKLKIKTYLAIEENLK